MTINEIFLKDEISVRAFNTCTDNEIKTISELKEHFNTYGSFKNFRNCEKKTNSELVEVCLKYFDQVNYENKENSEVSNLNILKLLESYNKKQIDQINNIISINFKKLSTNNSVAVKRYLNGCINVDGFLEYIYKNPFFDVFYLKEYEEISYKEIEDFIKEISNSIININSIIDQVKDAQLINNNNDDNFKLKVTNLNRTQRQIVNNFILILSKQLSVRSYNGLCKYINSEPNIILLTDKIFVKDYFDISKIQNIGDRTLPELNNYLTEIKKFVNEVFDIDNDDELDKLETKFFLQKEFVGIDISNCIDRYNSIFKLINLLIDDHYLVGNFETFILKHTHKIYTDSIHVNLESIAKDISFTGERIRQIRNGLICKIDSKLKFLGNYNKDILLEYNIDTTLQAIIVDDLKASKINLADQTNFSKQFITYILSVIYKDNYSLLGNKEDALILKETSARFRHNWKNIYLLKKELEDYFDFNKLIEDVEERLNQKINETYKFNFKSYLSRFLKENNFTIIDEIFSTCEKILFEEFNLFLSVDEEILFERNTFKTLTEYAYEALEILGKPSHISEINRQIKILKPDYENEIKNTTFKRKFGFISFSRTSTYGLKKWESENNTIRGGTIRSIAEEFLLKFDKPMHISEIAEYVLKYRPESNEKSIIYNLKMEDNNRFLFFKKSLIGLKSKKYDDYELVLLDETDKIEKKTWDENYQELINFIEKNNRLPSSMSCPGDEIKINRWLNVQRSKKNNGILEENKIDKINQVVSNYNVRVNKTKLFRNEGYEKLAQFIIKEKRLPSPNKTDESQLYAFFYKQRKLFEEGNLSTEEETKFIDVAKLIQNK